MNLEADLKAQLKDAISQRDAVARKIQLLEANLLEAGEKGHHLEKALHSVSMKLTDAKNAWEAAERQAIGSEKKLKEEMKEKYVLLQALRKMEKEVNHLSEIRASLMSELAASHSETTQLKAELSTAQRLAALYPWGSILSNTNSLTRTLNQSTKLALACPDCGSSNNVYLDLVCRSCGSPLLNFGFVKFLLLALCLSGAGTVIGYIKDPRIAFVIIQLLFLAYISVLLRKRPKTLTFGVGILLVASAIILAVLFGHSDIPLLYHLPSFGAASLFLIAVGMSIYLWYDKCLSLQTKLLRGLGILSFLIFVLSLVFIGAIQAAAEWGSPEHLGSLSDFSQNVRGNGAYENFLSLQRIRAAMFAISSAYLLVLALTDTFKRKIQKPAPVFPPLPAAGGFSGSVGPKSRTAIFFLVVYRVFSAIFRYANSAVRAATNHTKIGLEYALKYSWAFMVELILLLGELIEVSLAVLRSLTRRCLLPVATALSLATVGALSAHSEYLYLSSEALPPFWGVLLALTITLVALPLFIWSLNGMPLSSVADSVTSSTFIVGFVLLVSLLVSSLFLWALAQFLPGLPYETAGPFIRLGSAIAVVGIILVALYNWILHRLHRKPGSGV